MFTNFLPVSPLLLLLEHGRLRLNWNDGFDQPLVLRRPLEVYLSRDQGMPSQQLDAGVVSACTLCVQWPIHFEALQSSILFMFCVELSTVRGGEPEVTHRTPLCSILARQQQVYVVCDQTLLGV